MALWQEFCEFAMEGNGLDMAVGMVTGVAFNKIVNSLVNYIALPPIGLVPGGVDFEHLQVVLRTPPPPTST
jgi:large conductance mechanosensitive channel